MRPLAQSQQKCHFVGYFDVGMCSYATSISLESADLWRLRCGQGTVVCSMVNVVVAWVSTAEYRTWHYEKLKHGIVHVVGIYYGDGWLANIGCAMCTMY